MNFFQNLIAAAPPASGIIISVALMLFLGFAMTRLTKRLKLPNVTAYILTGILIGPFCLRLIPTSVIAGMDFLSDIALAFIAFGTGEFFRFSQLKKNGAKVVVITLAEACLASLLVFGVCFFVLRLEATFCAVLAALAAATAPASTLMTMRQMGARGDFVDTLLQVVALDDIVSLVGYSVAIAIAAAAAVGGRFDAGTALLPLVWNLLVLLLGGVFGWLLTKLMPPKRRSTDNRLIISVSLLFAVCGICSLAGVSPLLGCMSMGMIYINLSGDEKLFKQLNYFSPPILLLFFVRSGLNFRFDALFSSGAIGSVPLLAVGIIYFLVRVAGKYLGAFFGCLWVGKPKETRRFLGLALIPQAGVAIGLAALGARTLGGERGVALETIILASSVLYELVGPACAKLSLYLSHSYSDKLEDIVPVESTTPQGVPKTEAEKLIERIHAIQKTLPPHLSANAENEQAFSEAADEYYENTRMQTRIRRRR
ncbi:MAG: cation:proton antiporter [Clostridia bacterium]|nr:cation:proton antiporter [Clostridia bacterium]